MDYHFVVHSKTKQKKYGPKYLLSHMYTPITTFWDPLYRNFYGMARRSKKETFFDSKNLHIPNFVCMEATHPTKGRSLHVIWSRSQKSLDFFLPFCKNGKRKTKNLLNQSVQFEYVRGPMPLISIKKTSTVNEPQRTTHISYRTNASPKYFRYPPNRFPQALKQK